MLCTVIGRKDGAPARSVRKRLTSAIELAKLWRERGYLDISIETPELKFDLGHLDVCFVLTPYGYRLRTRVSDADIRDQE